MSLKSLFLTLIRNRPLTTKDMKDSIYPDLISLQTSTEVGYKEYVAIINQSSTNPPVSTILSNTLGVVPIWNYNSPGDYTLNSSSFTENKTIALMSTINLSAAYHFSIIVANNSSVQITSSINSTPTNAMIVNTTLQIRVYP